MTAGSHLYAVRIGHVVKVGITSSPTDRYQQYKRDAKTYDLAYELLHETPPHEEAGQNERAILSRFRPARQRTEYLKNVDPAELIEFIETLPQTPCLVGGAAPDGWLSIHTTAERIGVTVASVNRYIANGFLNPRRAPRQSWFDPAEVEQLRRKREGEK